jgi:S1-C subfamily serine protease
MLSLAPIVQHVAPTVVNVYASKVVTNCNPLFRDPFLRRFFGQSDTVVRSQNLIHCKSWPLRRSWIASRSWQDARLDGFMLCRHAFAVAANLCWN